MKINKIHHIAIICSDYEQAKRFYCDILKFEIVRENKREDSDDIKIDLKLGDCEIELFIKSDCPKRLSYPEGYGLRHIAFYIDSVETFANKLNDLGVKTEPIRVDPYTNKKFTFLSDPDGLPIEIHE